MALTIATTNLLPNVVMAFLIIQALKITGLLDWVEDICEPVMALWGLPGEVVVLLAALMSMGGAVGVAASWQPPRINRSRCHRFTARDVFNGQPGAKCRSLPGDSQSECQILPAYHYGLRD